MIKWIHRCKAEIEYFMKNEWRKLAGIEYSEGY